MVWPDPFTRNATAKVGNLDIHVAEAGDGPPVVLLHGNPDTHSVWARVVDKLAPAHRCIAPDLPGFGRSMPADFEFTLDNEAAFVRGLADALELPRMHLVVHDIGGPFGLAFATLHPERIASITIFNTIFSAEYRWHFWGRVWRTRVLGELSTMIANGPLFVRELRRGSPNMPRDYAQHAWREFHKTARKTVLRWYRASDPERYDGWDERFREATAKVPKQVLWGDRDPFIPNRFAEIFGVSGRHFAELGHWLMLEDTDLATTAIAELVARAGAAQTASA
jgi:pimeloyl-ACP methyl ester carboxylesterase